MSIKNLLFIYLLFSVLLFVGCRRAKIDNLVPARGIVTYNGEPVEGATIVFTPKNYKSGDRIGTGMTDKNGKFELQTIGELGILPNEYSVAVIKRIAETENNTKLPNNQIPKNTRPKVKIKSLIPERYSNAKTSGLNFIVDENGLKNIKIELVD
ncbi:MAG: DUF4198 domain-containing protein [Planctomycetaceae bacterium]|jgi:hypothetical protein|nr:DUF4198 domain-containing protein [Planctomycetaceae bacterium]